MLQPAGEEPDACDDQKAEQHAHRDPVEREGFHTSTPGPGVALQPDAVVSIIVCLCCIIFTVLLVRQMRDTVVLPLCSRQFALREVELATPLSITTRGCCLTNASRRSLLGALSFPQT